MVDSVMQAVAEGFGDALDSESLQLPHTRILNASNGARSHNHDLEPKFSSLDVSLGTTATREVFLGNHQAMAAKFPGRKAPRAEQGMPVVAVSSHTVEARRSTPFICTICGRTFSRRTVLNNLPTLPHWREAILLQI